MTGSIQRNVDTYAWYRVAADAYAWIPVFFLYFSQFVSLQDVLRLSSIYYFAVVCLEVPSGYFSDRFGRKTTLFIAACSFFIAYSLFLIGGNFWLLAVAQVFLAAAFAFQSGTDTAFHYDSLQRLGRQHEFAQREARAHKFGLISTALAALLGGLSGLINLRMPYLISLGASIVMMIMVFRFVEPEHHGQHTMVGFGRQLTNCIKRLHDPVLLWLFAFYTLMYMMEHVPYEFYQPYIMLLQTDWLAAGVNAPLVSGIVISVSMFGGAWGAALSVRCQDRFGLLGILFCAVFIQCGIIAGMAAVLHLAVLSLVFFRNFPMALVHAPITSVINPRIATSERATYLSIQSLAGRLGFAGLLFILSSQAIPGQAVDWSTLQTLLTQALIIGGVGMAILWVLSKPLRSHT